MYVDFYCLLCMLLSLGSIALIPVGIIYGKMYLWIGGILGYLLQPFICEALIRLWACLTYSEEKENKKVMATRLEMLSTTTDTSGKEVYKYLPLIYHPSYNLTACGLEKLHPFDASKYSRVISSLSSSLSNLSPLLTPWQPSLPPRGLLSSFCSPSHLFWLHYSIYVNKCIEMPLYFMPGSFLRALALNGFQLQLQGTRDGALLAMERGMAVNVGGGFHHCSRAKAGGFCVYPDITVGIKTARKYYQDREQGSGNFKSMIVDLDAHQGDGHERDFMGDPDVYIFDYFNPNVFPGDTEAAKAIKTELHVTKHTKNNEYISNLQTELSNALTAFKPDFILYNAGTDISTGDPLGRCNVSSFNFRLVMIQSSREIK